MGSTATTPKVAVAQLEAGRGFVVTCSQCPRFHTIRKHRVDADITATGHIRSHTRQTFAEED